MPAEREIGGLPRSSHQDPQPTDSGQHSRWLAGKCRRFLHPIAPPLAEHTETVMYDTCTSALYPYLIKRRRGGRLAGLRVQRVAVVVWRWGALGVGAERSSQDSHPRQTTPPRHPVQFFMPPADGERDWEAAPNFHTNLTNHLSGRVQHRRRLLVWRRCLHRGFHRIPRVRDPRYAAPAAICVPDIAREEIVRASTPTNANSTTNQPTRPCAFERRNGAARCTFLFGLWGGLRALAGSWELQQPPPPHLPRACTAAARQRAGATARRAHAAACSADRPDTRTALDAPGCRGCGLRDVGGGMVYGGRCGGCTPAPTPQAQPGGNARRAAARNGQWRVCGRVWRVVCRRGRRVLRAAQRLGLGADGRNPPRHRRRAPPRASPGPRRVPCPLPPPALS